MIHENGCRDLSTPRYDHLRRPCLKTNDGISFMTFDGLVNDIANVCHRDFFGRFR